LKVLHVLYQSHPNISGSSTRSRALVNAQKSIGLDPVVITSPFQVGVDENASGEIIDGIRYYRNYSNNQSFAIGKPKSIARRILKLLKIFPFFFHIHKIAKQEEVHLIHSHAMFFCALPSILASKLLKIPHVYEVRSDWSENSNFASSKPIKYLLRKLEEFVVKRSNHLVVISAGLQNRYKNIAACITLIPNAVSDQIIRSGGQMRLPEKKTVLSLGYIGSVIHLEGIEFVLEALAKIEPGRFNLLIAGNGNAYDEINNQIRALKLNNVEMLGLVEADKIFEVYKRIDIIINYRRNEPVANSVTPLKPLEAMAYKKLVVTSDVKGMTEIVTDMVTGVIVPSENPDLLAEKLIDIYENFQNYQSIALQGAKYVKEKKSWSENVLLYKNLYSTLTGNNR
jgi:glycogen(starch) synthase